MIKLLQLFRDLTYEKVSQSFGDPAYEKSLRIL
jgi:hypothetical protein